MLPAMTDAPAPPPPARRKSYKIAGPQTWALARELYLAGLPAPEVAARLGVSEHNLRKKATREGWSRRAHAELVLDVRLPKVGGDRRPASALAASAPAPTPEHEPEFDVEADPAEAADALARRAAGAAMAGRTEQAQGLLKAAEGLRRAAEASGPGAGAGAGAGGRWDDDGRWEDDPPRQGDDERWRRAGAQGEPPKWAEPPADPRDRRPCDHQGVPARPWTDARPPCTAGTCYVRASEAVIEGALAQLARLFQGAPDKASVYAERDDLALAEGLGRLAASGVPEQARALYAAGWARGLVERTPRPGEAVRSGAAGTAWEGAGSEAVPFPPPEPET